MKTILIVDDEKKIRQGLAIMIKRFNSSFENILEAKNGKEALEILKNNNVDVLLTDIVMPIMDGIELIKNIAELNKKPFTVILSGFDDFSYAKEAIKYGAKGYLLKPVDKEELQNTILKLENDVENEIESQTEIQNAKNLKPILQDLQEDLLNYIFINKNADESKLKNKFYLMGIKILEDNFYISILTEKNKSKTEKNDLAVFDKVKTFFSKDDSIILPGPEDQIIIISKNTPFKNLLNELNLSFKKNFVVGVSEFSNSIYTEYWQAYTSSLYKILFETEIIFYNDIKSRDGNFSIPSKEIKKISNMVSAHKVKESIDVLKSIFETSNYTITYYKQLAIEIYKTISEIIPNSSEKLISDFKVIKNIYNFKSIDEYILKTSEYFEKISEEIFLTSDESKNICAVEIATKYITENYKKDIDLAVVSNHVSLNYYYFSQLFKSNTGLNFTEYLKKYRLEKAKSLILNSELKIYEIAAEVGFFNPKHFIKAFKKEFGISPTEYRYKVLK